jgi:hypothetical protein
VQQQPGISMSTINTTLNNFSYASTMIDVFSEFPHEYEFDENGVIRRFPRPHCVSCGKPMNKNGYNSYTKKDLGTIKVGRWIHTECNTHLEEDRTFWETLTQEFFRYLADLTQVLRRHHLSYEGMSEVFSFIFPRSKETSRNLFLSRMDTIEFPEQKDIFIIHYDEQHPKQGRTQTFRLTLLNGSTRVPIADELVELKNSEMIKAFLARHLDPTQKVFIITDFFPTYPNIFEEFFVNGFYHQKCLLHLNKLIAKEFSRKCSMADELLKYQLLNIFYDRSKEVRYLKKHVHREIQMKDTIDYQNWLKKAKQAFYKYLRKLENKRRRKKANLILRSHNGSVRMFNRLMMEYNTYPKNIQKRLRMIKTNWDHLTMFHAFKGAPATNNAIENYYSTSLKSYQKHQYTSEQGIKNQMKLSWLRRLGRVGSSKKTIPQLLRRFAPFSIIPG